MKLHHFLTLIFSFCVSSLMADLQDVYVEGVCPLGETSFMVQTPEEWKIWDIAQDELRSFPEPLPASTMIVGVNQGIVCYLADGKTKLMSAQEKLSDYSWGGEDSVGCLILPFRGASPIEYKGCRYWGRLAFRGEKNVCAYIQLRDLKTYKLIHEFQFPEDLPDAPLKEILHGWVIHRFCSASTEYVLFQRGMSNLYCFQFCEGPLFVVFYFFPLLLMSLPELELKVVGL